MTFGYICSSKCLSPSRPSKHVWCCLLVSGKEDMEEEEEKEEEEKEETEEESSVGPRNS